MGIINRLVPTRIQRPYRNLQKRLDRLEVSVSILETAIDALVVKPRYVAGDNAGFNGQLRRKEIFKDIISAVKFDACAETGTWLGDTTAFMSETAKVPTHSCEVNPRFHALAKMRLAGQAGITLCEGDSRAFLRNLDLSEDKVIFFYLDAHRYEDAPLADELGIIATRWKNFVAMVDDFKVTGDDGYVFDNYPETGALDVALIHAPIQRFGLKVWFPSAPSGSETGAKRGCVVLSPSGVLSSKLSSLKTLRQGA